MLPVQFVTLYKTCKPKPKPKPISLLWPHNANDTLSQECTIDSTYPCIRQVEDWCNFNGTILMLVEMYRWEGKRNSMDIYGFKHCNNVIMGAIVSQITSLTIVFSSVYLDTDQRKHQRSTSLTFVGNSLEAGEFPAQMASNVEHVSIWWRHHDYGCI